MMKKFFKRFSKYSFWVSLSGAIVILLNAFGKAFNFSIENKVVEDCIMAIAGVLVVLGVVGGVAGKTDEDENVNEENNDKIDNE